MQNEFVQGMYSCCVCNNKCKKTETTELVLAMMSTGPSEERFVMKERGVFGPGGVPRMRILNRAISHGTMEDMSNFTVSSCGFNRKSMTKAVSWDKTAFITENPFTGPMTVNTVRNPFVLQVCDACSGPL